MQNAFIDQFHDHLTSCPNERLNKGVNRDLGELPDPTSAANANRIASAKRLLKELQAIDRTPLEFDEALDLELAELMLSSEVHRRELSFNGRSQHSQLPRGGDDVGDGLFLLMANDPREAPERLADIRSRLEKTPAYLNQLLDRLDTPVARWVAIDSQKVGALPELLAATVAFAKDNDWSETSAMESAASEAQQALDYYKGRLEQLDTTASLHIGVDDARKVVALQGIELSLEDLQKLARDFLQETGETLRELRGRLAPKYGLSPDIPLAELHQFLNKKFSVAAEGERAEAEPVLGRYRAERARVLAFIEERELFPIIDDQEMKILATPSFLEPSIPAGAMMPPPPFREGTRTSLIYLTIKPDQADDHTELGIPGMMIHEGIPGHHLQLATAATHASVIRRHFSASEHAEGWTTMLEDYMLDLGYMGDLADEARFTGKRDLSRIGARVLIDLFFMTGERSFLEVGANCDISSADPFEAAGSLLAEVTGFNPGRVQGELNWYSQERGYPLCYLTGNRLVWDLKRAAAKGPSGLTGLDLDRRFHASYLSSGNMPLSFLKRVMAHEGLIGATA